MCVICCESVAEMKRYNVKRHYDSKHKKVFDNAYPGKGERLKEFKKRFDAYVGEAKRASVFAQGVGHLNEAIAIASVIPLLNTRCRLFMPKCSKRLSWLVPKLCLRVFRAKRKLSNR